MKIKVFKIITFNSEREQLPLEDIQYVDIERVPEHWKDVLIIRCKNAEKAKSLGELFKKLKNHPKFKDKFILFNIFENDEDKIEYCFLEELSGDIPTNSTPTQNIETEDTRELNLMLNETVNSSVNVEEIINKDDIKKYLDKTRIKN